MIAKISNTWRRRIEPEFYRFLPCKGVAMFHIGRCGSTVLAKMLDTHKSLNWDDETFNDSYKDLLTDLKMDGPQHVRDVLSRKMKDSQTKFFGFETKYLAYQHLSPERLEMSVPDYMGLLKDLGFQRFILLHRKNLLRRLISGLNAKQTNVWHITEEQKERPRLELNVQSVDPQGHSLLEHFDHVATRMDELKRLCAGQPFLEVYYEDDIENDPYDAYNKVVDFLSLPRDRPPIKLKRTNPFQVSEVLSNFQEVVSILKGTDHEWMLENAPPRN